MLLSWWFMNSTRNPLKAANTQRNLVSVAYFTDPLWGVLPIGNYPAKIFTIFRKEGPLYFGSRGYFATEIFSHNKLSGHAVYMVWAWIFVNSANQGCRIASNSTNAEVDYLWKIVKWLLIKHSTTVEPQGKDYARYRPLNKTNR